jgi:hypothetical protein
MKPTRGICINTKQTKRQFDANPQQELTQKSVVYSSSTQNNYETKNQCSRRPPAQNDYETKNEK